jgi:hypothetical protein
VGAPQEVGGSFYCEHNQLTSLEGAPHEVEEGFFCGNNQLTSLVGAPQEVGKGFYCEHNKLTSLEGAPQEVGKGFYCGDNKISEGTLKIIWKFMSEKKVDYCTALCLLKKDLSGNEDWEVLSKVLDENLSREAQKGCSMLGRFGFFE